MIRWCTSELTFSYLKLMQVVIGNKLCYTRFKANNFEMGLFVHIYDHVTSKAGSIRSRIVNYVDCDLSVERWMDMGNKQLSI